MIRTLWVYVNALVWTPWYATRIVGASLLGLKSADRICREDPRRWCRKLLWAAGVEVEFEGLDRLAGSFEAGGRILVSNHVSWFDVLALAGHLPVEYRFVAKRELGRVPFFGAAWKTCGHIAIDRSDRDAAIDSLDEAARQIREREVTVVIFPEGTRSRDGRLLPFKKGAFVLAIQAGVPVVPAAILGSRRVMPKGRWTVRPGRIRIRIGEPVSGEEYTLDSRDHLLAEIRARISDLLVEGEDEGYYPGGRATSGL